MRTKISLIKHKFVIALKMIRETWKTLEVIQKTILHAIIFFLDIGAVTALLTSLQIYLGFEDISGFMRGGQAEYLAKDCSTFKLFK